MRRVCVNFEYANMRDVPTLFCPETTKYVPTSQTPIESISFYNSSSLTMNSPFLLLLLLLLILDASSFSAVEKLTLGWRLVGRPNVRMIGLRADMVLAWMAADVDLSTGSASRRCAISGIGRSFTEDSVLGVAPLKYYSAVSVSPGPRCCTILGFVRVKALRHATGSPRVWTVNLKTEKFGLLCHKLWKLKEGKKEKTSRKTRSLCRK